MPDKNWGANPATVGLLPKAVHILTLEKVVKLQADRRADMERKDKLEELNCYMRNLLRKPLTAWQRRAQMELNRTAIFLAEL